MQMNARCFHQPHHQKIKIIYNDHAFESDDLNTFYVALSLPLAASNSKDCIAFAFTFAFAFAVVFKLHGVEYFFIDDHLCH